MVVPASGHVILNPYSLTVQTDSDETKAQLIHQAQEIHNFSSFPVTLSAAATGVLGGDARFVSTPPDPDTFDKELFLYAEFQASPDAWAGAYTAAPNQLLVTDGASEERAVVELAAESELYFQLFGAMSSAPESAWGEENAFTVTLAYTFTRSISDTDIISETPQDIEEPETPAEVELPTEPAPPVEPESPETGEEERSEGEERQNE